MKNHVRGMLAVASFALLTLGCKDNQPEGPSAAGEFTDGVLVINGGNFSQNNGTLSFLKRGSREVSLNIFNQANGAGALPPADGRIEGYTEVAGTGMILFDHMTVGLDKLTFVEAGTMKVKSELTAPEIENPRAVLAVSERKAYVTNWDSFNPDYTYKEGYITIVDPTTGKSTGKISVGEAPEEMVLHQNKVYIGRFAGNGLAVVDTGTDAVTKSLTFEGIPAPIGVDAAGKLWVKEGPRFHRINPGTDAVELTLKPGAELSHEIGAATLTADRKGIVFVWSYRDANYKEIGNTYTISTTATSVSLDKPIFPRVFSALNADPVSQLIYGGVAPSATQSGYVIRANQAGVLQDSVKVEISPEGFFFK